MSDPTVVVHTKEDLTAALVHQAPRIEVSGPLADEVHGLMLSRSVGFGFDYFPYETPLNKLKDYRVTLRGAGLVLVATTPQGQANGPQSEKPAPGKEKPIEVGTDEWHSLDDRRAELIIKDEMKGGLTADERSELERLEELCDAALDAAFPRSDVLGEDLAELRRALGDGDGTGQR
jgi:hypothetical protein